MVGKYDEGLVVINDLLNADTTVSDVYSLKGLIQIKRREYEDARLNLLKAIKLKPYETLNYLFLGELCLFTRKYEDALQYLKESISLDSANRRAINSLGYVYFKLGKKEEAIKYYLLAKNVKKGAFIPYFEYLEEAKAIEDGLVPDMIQIEWLSPVEDVNKLNYRTLQWSKGPLLVKFRISSNQPIDSEKIKVIFNDNEIKTESVNVSKSFFNGFTGNYETDYQAVIEIKKLGVIKLNYNNRYSQELAIQLH